MIDLLLKTKFSRVFLSKNVKKKNLFIFLKIYKIKKILTQLDLMKTHAQ